MTQLRLAARDILFLLAVAVFIAIIVLINIYMPYFIV